MKVKTEDLTGPALDWAVAEANGTPVKIVCGILYTKDGDNYQPSADWAQGGPIIEREEIYLAKSILGGWTGSIYVKAKDYNCIMHAAPTPLIAAMRCYVASKLGDEIEVPDELFSFA
jgi:hypothetical protein